MMAKLTETIGGEAYIGGQEEWGLLAPIFSYLHERKSAARDGNEPLKSPV